MTKFKAEHILSVRNLTEAIEKGLVQRITRNLLDIQILRLIRTQSMWGYVIKKQVGAKFSVTLRHGALYPLLNKLEREGFLTSQRQQQGGRTRKVYTITQKGKDYVQTYEAILQDQIKCADIK